MAALKTLKGFAGLTIWNVYGSVHFQMGALERLSVKMTTTYDRHVWVEYAKGIGIFLVVYGHVLRGMKNAGLVDFDGIHGLIDSVIYSFHMPLFFFLAGLFFLNSLEKRGGQKFLKNKLDVIVYPYLLWSILQGVTETGLSQYTNGNTSFEDLFSLFWSPRQQFWFLYALFMIFCISAILFSFLKARHAVSIFLLSVTVALFVDKSAVGFNLHYVVEYLVYFMAGVLFAQCLMELRFERMLFLWPVCLGFLLCQLVLQSGVFNAGYLKSALQVVTAFAGVFMTVSICKAIGARHIRALYLMGTFSLSIYLLHIFSGSGIRIVFMKILGIESVPVHIAAGVICGLVIPLVFSHFVKKYRVPFVFSYLSSR